MTLLISPSSSSASLPRSSLSNSPAFFISLPNQFSCFSSSQSRSSTCPKRHRHHSISPQSSSFILSLSSIKSLPTRRTSSYALQATLQSSATSISSSLSSIQPATAPPNPQTLLTLLSTIVGICVLIGSVLYKLPQVLRVLRRKSAAGISVWMYALETLGTTLSALYFNRRAFPFSTYGETVFIMIQNFILLSLIVFYNDLPRMPAIILSILYSMMVILLISPYTPLSVLVVLQFCSIPILNLARVPQILLNYKRKATGELSPITLGLQLLGNVARIFTTIAQVRDPLMFVAVCVATCFNGTLFAQWVYYSRRSKAAAAS